MGSSGLLLHTASSVQVTPEAAPTAGAAMLHHWGLRVGAAWA